jgi:hypothetical protein
MGSGPPTPLRFDVLIIDEACQSTEASALIPFKYNPKVMQPSVPMAEIRYKSVRTACHYGRRSEAASCYSN